MTTNVHEGNADFFSDIRKARLSGFQQLYIQFTRGYREKNGHSIGHHQTIGEHTIAVSWILHFRGQDYLGHQVLDLVPILSHTSIGSRMCRSFLASHQTLPVMRHSCDE